MDIEKVITLPENPSEGDLVQDGVTGKYMYYRFGSWKEMSKEEFNNFNQVRREMTSF